MRRPGCTLRGCAFLLLLALGPAVARLLHEDASDIEQVDLSLHKVAEVSLQIPAAHRIGSNYVPAKLTADYTVVYNPNTAEDKLPILFLLPPWNMGFERVTRLVSRLCNAGYVVVTAHTRQTFPFPNENDDSATLNWCPEEQLVPSAAAISHFTLNIDQFWDALGPKAGPYPEIVIMGSRSGAWSALTVAAGKCEDSLEVLSDPKTYVYCNGYAGLQGHIKGVVVHGLTVDEVGNDYSLTGGDFLLWTVGEWEYSSTKPVEGSGNSCDTPIEQLLKQQKAQQEQAGACSGGFCTPDEQPAALEAAIEAAQEGAAVGTIVEGVAAEETPESAEPEEYEEEEYHPTANEWKMNMELTVGMINGVIREAVLGDAFAGQFMGSEASLITPDPVALSDTHPAPPIELAVPDQLAAAVLPSAPTNTTPATNGTAPPLPLAEECALNPPGSSASSSYRQQAAEASATRDFFTSEAGRLADMVADMVAVTA